jgi:hypothetical protein
LRPRIIIGRRTMPHTFQPACGLISLHSSRKCNLWII